MSYLTRRTFGLALLGALAPITAGSQDTPEPGATPPGLGIDEASMDGLVDRASRAFQAAAVGRGDGAEEGLVRLDAAILAFERQHQAAEALEPLADQLEAFVEQTVRDDPDFAGAGLRQKTAETARLGDHRRARAITVLQDREEAWSFAICLIQSDEWVQVLLGQAAGDAMTPTLELAAALIDRWPSDDLEDGLPGEDDVPFAVEDRS
jgi:hypothetical protein